MQSSIVTVILRCQNMRRASGVNACYPSLDARRNGGYYPAMRICNVIHKGLRNLSVTKNWRVTFRIARQDIEIIDLNFEDYH